MKRPSRLDYAYAVGRIHALEKYLIQQAVFREAADASDFSAALKIVYEAGRYPEELIQARNSGDLDAVLEKETAKLKLEMGELILEKEILEIFLLDAEPEKALPFARHSGYPFFLDYLGHRLDLLNIKVTFRAKYLNFSRDRLRVSLRQGGFIEPKFFLDHYDLSFSEMGERPEVLLYRDLCIRAADALEGRETFVALERGIEDFLMGYLRRARAVAFGPEPVFAYAEARKKELSLIRLLGVGKMAGLPAELLKERIGETYV